MRDTQCEEAPPATNNKQKNDKKTPKNAPHLAQVRKNWQPLVLGPELALITFKTAGGNTFIQIIDTLGRVIRILTDREYIAGTYTLDFNSEGLPTGIYYARFQNGVTQQVRAMMKVR